MNFFDNTLTVNQHYALALAQDYFVWTHYVQALSQNKDAQLQNSRAALAEIQARFSMSQLPELFRYLRSTTEAMNVVTHSVVTCTEWVNAVPQPLLQMLKLFLSFHGVVLPFKRDRDNVPEFTTALAIQLKADYPQASVSELVHLAVTTYDCVPNLAPGFELRDQYFSVLGPYVTLVTSAQQKPLPGHVGYTLFQGQPKYNFFDASQLGQGLQERFIQHAAMCNAYEILFPATIPKTVKLLHKEINLTPD